MNSNLAIDLDPIYKIDEDLEDGSVKTLSNSINSEHEKYIFLNNELSFDSSSSAHDISQMINHKQSQTFINLINEES